MGGVTFLFTDIEGSTALLRRLGDEVYGQLLAGHHALIRASLAGHGGEEVDTQGDAFFAVFDSPRACATAALEMQQKLLAHAWPGGEQLRVRMGMHTGEAAQTDTGWVGLDVHRAARIAAVGYGGQIVLSETTATLIREALSPTANLTDLGTHRLKDLGHPERIFQLHADGLPTGFPPLRSLGNPDLLNNLPAELTPFVGRDQELADLRSLVSSSRLVTLTGPGGCGKTRLGLQLAAELLDGSGDGVWLVELAPVNEEDAIASAVCEALRIQLTPGRPAPDALIDALTSQDLLIVLDNCEHLVSACAKIVDAILRRCPRVHVIATSREPLGISGEAIYRVPSLALPETGEQGGLESFDAVALFAVRARAHGVDLPLHGAAGQLAVSVCRRLDGLPLAIELAAARLRSMSLQELHDRLGQRFRLLTGGSRTALERQQTLRATVSWSYALLNPAEQSLLRRLPVFADSFDLTAAEAVCGFGDLDTTDVADLLGSLVDKSLVVAEQTGPALRYRLLETIRQYAAEKLAEDGTDHEAAAVSSALCVHYLGLAETAAEHLLGPDLVKWLLRLDAELANVRASALYAANKPDGTASVLRFSVALRRYWLARPRYEEAVLRLLLPALEHPAARDDLHLFGSAAVAAAWSVGYLDITTAKKFAELAMGVGRQLTDDRLVIRALAILALLHYSAGDFAAGVTLARESLQRARHLGDDVLLAEAVNAYLACRDDSDPARFEDLLAEALACTHRTGDLIETGYLHSLAARHYAGTGDVPATRTHHDEASRVMQTLRGEQPSFMTTNLGLLLRAEGDPNGARPYLERGLRLHRRDGDQVNAAYAIMGLACVASDQAEWARAAQLHGVADTLLRRKGVEWNDAGTRFRMESLARIHAHVGDDHARQAQVCGSELSFDEAVALALVPGLARTDG